MVPSGPPAGGAQSVSSTLLRSNSGHLSGGGGGQPNSQQPFSSIMSPRTQFNGNYNLAEPDPLSFASQLPGEPVQSFQQQQLRGGLGNGGGLPPVKLEPQMVSAEQNGPSQQQLQALRGMGVVKMEPQQLPSVRSMEPVKLEPRHSDSSMFLQQQQQQRLLQMSRQSPQALNLLQQQQRLFHLQQQQQQLLKGLPPRAQLQQQQFQLQQGLPARPQLKPSNYEPGLCARRLTQYMHHQKLRPEDNNIEFWRKFIAEFFAPNAKKRWCVSLYGSGRQTTGVFPQDVWHCEICNRKPGRGFETTAEVLPRLCQIKYASGTLEELLYVDMPRESHNAMGQVVLDYPKAIQESVFEQLRVVRDGHLRIVFNPDLKISSWEFCARKHEELIPRRLVIPQVGQLGAVVQKYQNAVQNASSASSTQDLQNYCNSFVASARQMAKALEVPLVNDLGYTKRYVRCLQISEVVNSMKDLIDYSRETKTGPMDSLVNFPRRNSTSGVQPQQQPGGQNQTIAENSNRSDQNSIHGSPSTSTTVGLLQHQNSMNSRQDNQLGSMNGPYGGDNMTQLPSASSSGSLHQPQPSPSSSQPTQSTSNNNNNNTTTHMNCVSSQQQQPAQPHEPDPSDSQSSVQQILQQVMMSSSPLNGSSAMGNEMKGLNGTTSMNGGAMVGNPRVGMGYGSMGGVGPSATVSGLRAAMANSAMGMNGGRAGMNHMSQDVMGMNHQQQQQNMGNRLMGGFAPINNFDNLQFDWKPSP